MNLKDINEDVFELFDREYCGFALRIKDDDENIYLAMPFNFRRLDENDESVLKAGGGRRKLSKYDKEYMGNGTGYFIKLSDDIKTKATEDSPFDFRKFKWRFHNKKLTINPHELDSVRLGKGGSRTFGPYRDDNDVIYKYINEWVGYDIYLIKEIENKYGFINWTLRKPMEVKE